MPEVGAAGFWSYAHDDNRATHGAVLELASAIKAEYDVLTGGDLNLFIDRDTLLWGDAWKERIDSKLTQTTFFIAIITPRYFMRPECRREFLAFLAQAESLGVREYLLPVLFASTPDLTVDSPDEMKSIVARTNFVDWRQLRLLDNSSSEYRREVHSLANRLVEIDEIVSTRSTEAARSGQLELPSDVDAHDLATLIDEIHSRLPGWHDAVVAAKTKLAQVDATYEAFLQRQHRLKKQRATASAHVSAIVLLGRELGPLAKEYLSLAQTYSKRSIELDPLITSMLHLLQGHPEDLLLIQPTIEAIEDAHESIENYAWRSSDDTGRDPDEFLKQNIRISRTFADIYRDSKEIRKLIGEGNEIAERWRTRIIEVSASAVPADTEGRAVES